MPLTPEKKQTPPKQARALKREQAIMDAAYGLVRDKGVDAVTTTSIARTASIPVGSVYRYYKDRADVLDQLYAKAFADIEQQVHVAASELVKGQRLGAAIQSLMEVYWRAAQDHPTYRPLTRWANAYYSMWQVTPGPNSRIFNIVEMVLETTESRLPDARKDIAMKTIVPTLSLLVDQALEAEDAKEANALLQEIGHLISAYVSSLTKSGELHT